MQLSLGKRLAVREAVPHKRARAELQPLQPLPPPHQLFRPPPAPPVGIAWLKPAATDALAEQQEMFVDDADSTMQLDDDLQPHPQPVVRPALEWPPRGQQPLTACPPCFAHRFCRVGSPCQAAPGVEHDAQMQG